MLYDISLSVGPGLALWPGDPPYSLARVSSLRLGDPVNLSAATLSLHAGTHVDAPLHLEQQGADAAGLDLHAYLGPALVVEAPSAGAFGLECVRGLPLREHPRVLFRTAAWPDPSRFPDAIPAMTADLVDHLAAQGVLLVGVDVPSVDALDSTDLPNHRRLLRHGVAILESLRLSHVPPGPWELIALPLRLKDADASPVRAVLRPLAPA